MAGGSDVWVRLLDTETGAEVATQRGHHGKVHCVRFAPNGATYTSGADDATIRMWKYDDAASSPRATSAVGGAAAAAGAGGAGVAGAGAALRAGGAVGGR